MRRRRRSIEESPFEAIRRRYHERRALYYGIPLPEDVRLSLMGKGRGQVDLRTGEITDPD